jgi:hypothetical protein
MPMALVKDYAFASGGILWKVLDRRRFEIRPLKHQFLFVLGLMVISWLPLAILSYFNLKWNLFSLLFLRDMATHVRFLFVLPILLFARRSFNQSFNQSVHFFHETKIVDSDNEMEFRKVLDRLEQWKNSKRVDLVLILLVYSSFYFQENIHLNHSDNYAPWHIVAGRITSAGWYYLVFSLPLLQMLLYRWLYTILLWIIFLYKISKLGLHLSSFHPDGVGGLGFLKYTQLSFFPVALAFSALTAGMLNNMVIFSHASILEYKIVIGSVLLFVLMIFILPLLLLLPLLAQVKRKYYIKYSKQAWPIARKYEDELLDYYLHKEDAPDASLHVDMIGSFEKTDDMKIILVDKGLLITFVAAVVIPFLPVIAQQIPLKEIFVNLLGKILG